MANVSTITLCFLLAQSGFARTDSLENGFSGDVKQLFKDLIQTFNIGSCIRVAETKMNQFKQYSLDKKYAVAIINLYTQDCAIPGLGKKFYQKLNEELRSKKPAAIWKMTGDLINKGIDVLGLQVYGMVYRGCMANINTGKGQQFSFNQITSTSVDAAVSLQFASCKDATFLEVQNVRGTPIASYSAFPTEAEVILKYTDTFLVLEYATNPKEVKKEMDKIVKHVSTYPSAFVRLKGKGQHESRMKSDDKRVPKYSFELQMH